MHCAGWGYNTCGDRNGLGCISKLTAQQHFALSQFSPPIYPFARSTLPKCTAVHVIDNIQVNVSDDDGGVGHGYTIVMVEMVIATMMMVKWAMMMTMVVVKWNPSVGALACHDSLLTDDWGERLVTLFAFQIVYSEFFKFCILNFGFIFYLELSCLY